MLLDLLPLEQHTQPTPPPVGGGGGGIRYVCGYCLTPLYRDEDCPHCAATARRMADELALIALGIL